MQSMVVRKANEPFVLEKRTISEPGPGEVRVQISSHGCIVGKPSNGPPVGSFIPLSGKGVIHPSGR